LKKHFLMVLSVALAVIMLCSCGRGFKINIVSGADLLDDCPKRAEAGETVTLYTMVATDGDMYVSVNGDPEFGRFVQDGIYEFVMPAEDVEISIWFISNGLA